MKRLEYRFRTMYKAPDESWKIKTKSGTRCQIGTINHTKRKDTEHMKRHYTIFIRWDADTTTHFETQSLYTESEITELCDWFVIGNEALDSWAIPV